MVAWPEALIREVADRRVLLFVGAGISKAALPTMPTWTQLLRDLSNGLPKKVDRGLVSKLIRQNRLLDAAQIITDGIDRADLNAVLRKTFQIRPSPHHKIYDVILKLDIKTIITTNYDEFLEKNFDYYSGGAAAYNVCKHTSGDFLNQVRSPRHTIAKIHGCITEPDDLILDRRSYFRERQKNSGFFSIVSSLFTSNTVLFVGYSLGDPDLQVILENIHAVSASTSGHYSLTQKVEHRSMVKAIKQSYNISCIEYPTGAHDAVLDGLNGLLKSVEADRAGRGII